jgi:hypothetical protein
MVEERGAMRGLSSRAHNRYSNITVRRNLPSGTAFAAELRRATLFSGASRRDCLRGRAAWALGRL